MANESEDALTTGVLLLGGGAAGYALGRFVVARWLDARQARSAQPSAPPSSLPVPSASSSSAASPTPTTTLPPATTSSPSPATKTSASSPAPRPDVTRPSKPRSHVVGPPIGAKPIDPYASMGPITKPSQLAASSGPITSPSQLAASEPDPKPIDPYSDSTRLGASLAAALVGPPQDAKPIDPYADASKLIEMPEDYVGRPPRVVGPPASAGSSAVSQRTRRFDPVFARYRGAIPIEYLRALVERESSGNPLARTGSAYGLMQIVPVVRDDYNKRHGTPYQPEHLYDPSINVGIGCELLHIIIANYRRYHPRIPNLTTNWDNPRFVELLTFGWNAGFSEAGGVGRVASYLEKLGAIDITIDLVHEHARIAGASKYLSNPAKVRWSNSVVALYVRERERRSARSARAT